MPKTITHIPSPSINVCGRTIQRCAVCGELLLDSLNAAAPTNPDGSVPDFPVWPGHSQVRVTDGNPVSQVLLADEGAVPVEGEPGAGKLAEDSCYDLRMSPERMAAAAAVRSTNKAHRPQWTGRGWDAGPEAN